MSGDEVALQKDVLPEIVLKTWHEVIRAMNTILKANERFGFQSIEANIDPKLSDILYSLQIAESFLALCINNPDQFDYDSTRRALNASQCVLQIRLVAIALKSGDQDSYDNAIRKLENQAQH